MPRLPATPSDSAPLSAASSATPGIVPPRLGTSWSAAVRLALLWLGLVALPAGVGAADYEWLDSPQLIIFDAKLDPETKMLRIKGEHFGLRLPTMTLDSVPITVREATQTYI